MHKIVLFVLGFNAKIRRCWLLAKRTGSRSNSPQVGKPRATRCKPLFGIFGPWVKTHVHGFH